MNAISKISKPILCPSCDSEGKFYTSRYGGNDPDTWVDHHCADCNGTRYAVGEFAQALEIKDAMLHVTALIQQAISDRLGDNAAEQETVKFNLVQMLADCDMMLADCLDGGVLHVLSRERVA